MSSAKAALESDTRVSFFDSGVNSVHKLRISSRSLLVQLCVQP